MSTRGRVPRGARRKSKLVLAVTCVALTGLAISLGGVGAAGRCGSCARKTLYWGVWSSPNVPWSMAPIRSFQHLVGKGLSLIEFGAPFESCETICNFYEFPTSAMNRVRSYGAVPFFSWSSQGYPYHVAEPGFRLHDIYFGRYDGFIRRFALAAKRWGHPFFLRFDWEMNGDWFPWSERTNENGPGQYVAAWRHVHDIFTSVGATKATWVWCPNVDARHQLTPLSELYPGDKYVDWTCLDGYNWGTNPANPAGWLSFDQTYRSTYRQITTRVAPSKPMIIGEIASTGWGGSKAAWVGNTLSRLARSYPRIRGVIWMEHVADGVDWPIELAPGAISAFTRGIASSAFVANRYKRLGAAPIAPPGS